VTPGRAAALLNALPLAMADIDLEREQEIAHPVLLPSFRGAALEAQAACDAEWILSGPAETGKTYAGLFRLDTLLRQTPKANAAIVRKVRQDMSTTVLRTFDRIIDIRGHVSRFGGERAEFYSYPNGARAYVAGLDDPTKVLSSEMDFCYVNQAEQLTLSDWEFLSTRTTGRGAVTRTPMLMGDCNPGPPKHWLKTRPSVRLLESHHADNPTLYDEAGNITEQGKRSMSALQALTGIRRSRYFEGLWISSEGSVYRDFDRNVHVIKRSQMPPIVHWVCGVDFGFSNPFSWQRWGFDDDGAMYLEREFYQTKTLVEDHASRITKLNQNFPIEATVADHDAEGRATLERRGINTTLAFKSISEGIQNLQQRMVVGANGKPRFFILEDACVGRDESLAAMHKPTCFLDEIEGYVWPSAPDGKTLKEVPVKESDHACDVSRYVAAFYDHLEVAGAGNFAAAFGEPAVYWSDEDEGHGPGDAPDDEGRGPGDGPDEEWIQ
jgi:PBSX family phage terminase large subunit